MAELSLISHLDDGDSDAVQNAIARALVYEVTAWLQTEPPLLPRERASLSRFLHMVCERVGLPRQGRHSDSRLLSELVCRVEEAATEHFQTALSTDDENLARPTPPALSAADLEILASTFAYSAVALLYSLGGGLSGAGVFLAVLSRGSHVEFGVIKVSPDEMEQKRELSGHRRAYDSWLKDMVTDVPKSYSLAAPARGVLLSTIDLPFDDRLDRPPTLKDAIRRGDLAYRNAVEKIGRHYSSLGGNVELGDPSGRLVTLLEHWPAAKRENAWTRLDFWSNLHVPQPSHEFADDGTARWINPLWWLRHISTSRNQGRQTGTYISVRNCFQHGDLNTGNVLLHAESSEARFIDFEKASDTADSFLDVAWLALWIMRDCDSPAVRTDDWVRLPAHFVSLVSNGKESETHGGAFDIGYRYVGLLVKGFVSCEQDLNDVNRKVQRNARRVTLSAAALAMAFYEVRAYNRLFDQGNEASNSLMQEHSRWALIFLAVAGRALDPVLKKPEAAQSSTATFAWHRALVKVVGSPHAPIDV